MIVWTNQIRSRLPNVLRTTLQRLNSIGDSVVRYNDENHCQLCPLTVPDLVGISATLTSAASKRGQSKLVVHLFRVFSRLVSAFPHAGFSLCDLHPFIALPGRNGL